jgi:transcription initiation factor TFIIH subunit 3
LNVHHVNIKQKSIPLDVCKIYGEEAAFLQQASNITGGVYVMVENPQALLQYLMVKDIEM